MLRFVFWMLAVPNLRPDRGNALDFVRNALLSAISAVFGKSHANCEDFSFFFGWYYRIYSLLHLLCNFPDSDAFPPDSPHQYGQI